MSIREEVQMTESTEAMTIIELIKSGKDEMAVELVENGQPEMFTWEESLRLFDAIETRCTWDNNPVTDNHLLDVSGWGVPVLAPYDLGDWLYDTFAGTLVENHESLLNEALCFVKPQANVQNWDLDDASNTITDGYALCQVGDDIRQASISIRSVGRESFSIVKDDGVVELRKVEVTISYLEHGEGGDHYEWLVYFKCDLVVCKDGTFERTGEIRQIVSNFGLGEIIKC